MANRLKVLLLLGTASPVSLRHKPVAATLHLPGGSGWFRVVLDVIECYGAFPPRLLLDFPPPDQSRYN